MRWPRKTTRLPDDARAALLAPGERVLAAAPLTGGGWLVASDRGLLAVGLRVGWSTIIHAQWYDDESRLSVTWLAPAVAHERSLMIEEPGRLPETVHERVTATILLSRRVQLPDRRGVRVVARRQPGCDDLRWQVVPDPGVDASAPVVSARVEAAKRDIAAELGR